MEQNRVLFHQAYDPHTKRLPIADFILTLLCHSSSCHYLPTSARIITKIQLCLLEG